MRKFKKPHQLAALFAYLRNLWGNNIAFVPSLKRLFDLPVVTPDNSFLAAFVLTLPLFLYALLTALIHGV